MADVMKPNLHLSDYLEAMYGRKITDTEYEEYKQKLVQYFSILIEIDQRQKRKALGGGENK